MEPSSRVVGSCALRHEEWCALGEAVERFEDAWRSGNNADPAEYAIDRPPGLRLRSLIELLKVDLEFRTDRGESARVESLLARWPELSADRAILRELIEAECITRCGLGQRVTETELGERFPEIAAEIDLAAIRREVAENGWSRVVAETVVGSGDTQAPVRHLEDLPDGTRVGRYVIRGLVGRGGMGAVYRAHDPELQRDVALKLPGLESEADSELAERFQAEVRRAAAVDHPHLCSIYDAGVADGRAYLAMELIEGVTIAEQIHRGSLAARVAAEVTLKIARALGRLHEAGIIHRDISAGNVMLDRWGEPRLMDFGLARMIGETSAASCERMCSGTPEYVAPELLRDGAAKASPRSDIYSLGVLLRQMISREMTLGAGRAAVQVARPNSQLQRIVERATVSNPDERYGTVDDVVAEIESFLGRRETSRSVKRTAAVAAVVAAGCLAIGWSSLWRSSSHRMTEEPTARFAAVEEVLQRGNVDAHGRRARELRAELMEFLREEDAEGTRVQAASLLLQVPWMAYEECPANEKWWNRLPWELDAEQQTDSGPIWGNEVTLVRGGEIYIGGRVAPKWPHDQFELVIEDPGPLYIEIFAVTEGVSVTLWDAWGWGEEHGDSNSESTRESGYRLYPIRNVPDPPHNLRRIRVTANVQNAVGEYLLRIWQPERE